MDYKAHLEKLREYYFRAPPSARLNIANQRIQNPEHGPNILITHVSAIEGMLRSLVMWAESGNNNPNAEIYKKYKFHGIESLYKRYCELKSCAPITSELVFELVGYAVEYRNLLAHDCTYLGQDRFPQLIQACEEFLSALCKHAGIKNS